MILVYISMEKGDLRTRVCSSLCRVVTKAEWEKRALLMATRKLFVSHHLWMWCELILMWENIYRPTGPTSDLIPLSTGFCIPSSISNTLATIMISLFLFGKFIDHFVVKSISITVYLHLLQKVFIYGNENQIT